MTRRTMWIVRLALRRPYTFMVMALLMLVLGGASIFTMRKCNLGRLSRTEPFDWSC